MPVKMGKAQSKATTRSPKSSAKNPGKRRSYYGKNNPRPKHNPGSKTKVTKDPGGGY